MKTQFFLLSLTLLTYAFSCFCSETQQQNCPSEKLELILITSKANKSNRRIIERKSRKSRHEFDPLQLNSIFKIEPYNDGYNDSFRYSYDLLTPINKGN